jgi:uncharacterized protein YjbI with pentapeptide repeats
VGLFDKRELKIKVRKVGRIPPSNLSQLTIASETRTDQRFEKVRLDAISIHASRLIRCVFMDVHAKSVNLGGGLFQSTYTDCIFEDCDFVFGAVGNARFSRCRFNRCRLSHIFGTRLEMLDCSFPETRIEQAVFHGASLASVPGEVKRERNEFSGNDFSAADLVDVSFRGGIDLTKQALPTGRDYIFVADMGRASIVAQEISELNPGSSDAKRAQLIQRMLEFLSSSGQRQTLLRLSGFEALADQLREKLG